VEDTADEKQYRTKENKNKENNYRLVGWGSFANCSVSFIPRRSVSINQNYKLMLRIKGIK